MVPMVLFAPISDATMGDDPLLSKFVLDKFETTDDGGSPLNWEVDAWIGKDFNKFWLKSEGEYIDSSTEQSNELLFSHAVSPFWDIQAGYRQDRISSTDRDFFSIGVQGVLPYLIETDASLVLGEKNQVGLDAEFEYEFTLTQRWVLVPELDLSFWSEDDLQMGVGSGLSETELSLRLGYEIRREFTPYIGVSWSKKFGNTADFARDEGEDINSILLVAGFRLWF